MKKLLTILIVALVICSTVSAIDLSIGAFGSKKKDVSGSVNFQINNGGFVSVSDSPIIRENSELGCKADFVVGKEKSVERMHYVASLKGTVSHDYENFTFMFGTGFAINTLVKDYMKIGSASEFDISYHVSEKTAIGASFDFAYVKEDSKFVMLPAAKLFTTVTLF